MDHWPAMDEYEDEDEISSSSSYPGLSLIASPRALENEGNLFVRLTPQTVRRLASLVSQCTEFPEPDFLPLEIVIKQRGRLTENTENENIVVYASYNGGAPVSPAHPSRPYGPVNSDGIIELPLDLHPSLVSVFNSTSEPVLASVRPLSDVPVGERVTIEPLSSSDWEMIEMEASALEDGGLLNQITVVSPGQVFPLRLGGRLSSRESAAWIKVVDVSCAPSCQDTECDESYSSDSEFYSSIDSSSDKNDDDLNSCRHKCVRLMAETEVEVIPKPRKRKENQVEEERTNNQLRVGPVYSPSAPLRVQPITAGVSNANSAVKRSTLFPNPPLGSVCVHPSTLAKLNGYHPRHTNQCQSGGQSEAKVDLPPTVVTIRKVRGPYAKHHPHQKDERRGIGSDVAVATIQACNNTHIGHVGMHQLLCYQLDVSPLACWVSLQIWSESHVAESINNARERAENIELVKVSITKHPENRSVVSLTSDMTHSTCEFCNKNKTAKDSPSTSALLFSSGSFVPLTLLQSLGFDWLDQHRLHDDIFILKYQSALDSLGSSDKNPTDRKKCLPPDTAQLIPVFTAGDLANLSKTLDGYSYDELNTFSFDIRGISPVLSFTGESLFSGESPDFFSCAVKRVMQSASQIIQPCVQARVPFISESMMHYR